VRSSFAANDAEGWTTVNFRNQPDITGPIRFDHSGGQYWLAATRKRGQDGPFYWSAPAKFLGDQTDKHGRWFVYSTFVKGKPAADLGTSHLVTLRGPGGALAVKGSDMVHKTTPYGWKVSAARLGRGGGWVWKDRPGAEWEPATVPKIRAVLADVKALLVRGEYGSGPPPEGCIDEVILGAIDPP
jgi:hypothetical protein